MIPSIFISSTIQDLQHLRDAIRESVEELCYNPVMSEYGDIGYLPKRSAIDSCYKSVVECQIAVLMVGKRYGQKTENGKSVTHNEFLTAQEKGIPVITLVDKEIMTFKRIYDANKDSDLHALYPGMDDADNTFSFVQSVMDSKINNGILPYSNIVDARLHFKRQLAHMFGEMLQNSESNVATSLKDVLSEVKTLRHEVSGMAGAKALDFEFLNAIRYLVDESNNHLKKLVENCAGPIDAVIPTVSKCNTFEDFICAVDFSIQETSEGEYKIENFMSSNNIKYMEQFVIGFDSERRPILGSWAVSNSSQLFMPVRTLDYFRRSYEELKRVMGQPNHGRVRIS